MRTKMKANNKKILLFIFAVLSLVFILFLYFRPQQNTSISKSLRPRNFVSSHTNSNLSMDQLNSKLNKKSTFTVMFYESSCPPCKKELKDLKKTNLIDNLFLLNLDKAESIGSKQFKALNIQYTPTILKIYKGKVVFRHEGYASIPLLKKIKLSDFSKYKKNNSINKIWKPISRRTFDQLKVKEKSFIVYVGRPTCPDCKSFEHNLQKYNLSSYKNNIYYLNIEKYPFSSKSEWKLFKRNNNIKGVPAFISYKRGKYFSSSSWTISKGYSPETAISWLEKQDSKK